MENDTKNETENQTSTFHEYNEKNINVCNACAELYYLHGSTHAQVEDYHKITFIANNNTTNPPDYLFEKRFDASIKDFANPPKGYVLQAKSGIFQSQKDAYEYVKHS